MRRQMVSALVTIAMSAVPAVAQERASLTDRQIQAQIEQRLEKKDIDRVAVGVNGGTVSLSGNVPSAWAKKTAVEQALKVKDVVGVANDLAVTHAESDQALAAQIASKVRRYTRYTIFDDVNIGVEGGVATLTGRVTMPYKADDLGDLASRVEGVQEVRNQIQTLPVSIYDDRIRASIARQIYRNPLFSNYAIQVNPPIHIIVEGGRVTLTGAVASQVELVKAEAIARSTFGVFNVENQLRVAP
jgi:osmotically-inducible protein OsmY